MARVDGAVVSGTTIGARAVWDASTLRQVIVTRASPDTTGMSALVGFFQPVSPREPRGMLATVGDGAETQVTAPLAPGVIVTIGVKDVRPLQLGEAVALGRGPFILALDGEREVPVGAADSAEVRLSAEGPWLVDIRQAMHFAVTQGAFSQSVLPAGSAITG
jgi:hypothetical protein